MTKLSKKALSLAMAILLILSYGLNLGEGQATAASNSPVTTEEASEITGSTARLNASVSVVNSVYSASNPQIYYWKHVDGVTERPVDALSVTSDYIDWYGNFSGKISGLEQLTQYDYQASVLIKNDSDSYEETEYGQIKSFTTLQGGDLIVDITQPELEVPNMTSLEELKQLLPKQVVVSIDDNTTRSINVEWDTSRYENESWMFEGWKFNEVGGYLPLTGTWTLPDSINNNLYYVEPRLDLYVKYSNLTSVPAAENITAPVGTTLAEIRGLLPESLLMSFDNGKEAEIPVSWGGSTPEFITGVPGTYTFEGTPVCFQPSFARQGSIGVMGGGEECNYYNPDKLTTTAKVTIAEYAWQLVGPAGFTGAAEGLSLAYDASGAAYVSFADADHNDAISVMEYNGTSWEYVGAPGFSEAAVGTTSLKFNDAEDGALYAAYTEAGTNRIVVSTYNGTVWTEVGVTDAVASSPDLFSFSFVDGRPVIAFADEAESGSLSVKVFYKDEWEYQGPAGFSNEAVQAVTLTPSDYNNYIVSYIQNGELNAAIMYSYMDEWQLNTQTGTPVELLSQAVNSYEDQYVVYQDAEGIRYKMIGYYRWTDYAPPAITDGPVQLLDFAFDAGNTPYIAYTDSANASKVTVQKLVDGSWQTVGAASFTAGSALELKLQIIKGQPHVAIVDDNQQGKVTVLNFRSFETAAVQTASAANVTTTTATVGGTVTGTATVTGIVYGTSADLSGETFNIEAPQNNGSFTVMLNLLNPATVYYVRAYAVTPKGIVYGELVPFTTLATPEDGGEDPIPTPTPDPTPTPTPTPMPTPMPENTTVTVSVPNAIKVVITNTSNGGTVNAPITQQIGTSLKLMGKLYNSSGQAVSVPEFTINADGSFIPPNVPQGTYRLALNVIAPNGERLAGQLATLTVGANGAISIDAGLIDPYGVITDSVTGKPVEGVNVSLHWSDTELNRSKGRTPGALVTLPELPDFAPNKNHDPQTSNAGGQYGWMVYPDGDYYILGEKEGYLAFDSRKDTAEAVFGTDSYIRGGNIHVGQTIVEYSFTVTPSASGQYEPYMKGYPDGSFLPGKGVSRAEMAAILSRTMTLSNSPAGSTTTFADIPAGFWASADIATAVQQGWFQGTGNNRFQPQLAITRAEMAQLLTNVYGWTAAGSVASAFSDVNGHWAEAAIHSAEAQGALAGYPDGTFRPNQPITRAEAVTLINKLLARPAYSTSAPVWSDVPASYWAYGDIMAASIRYSR